MHDPSSEPRIQAESASRLMPIHAEITVPRVDQVVEFTLGDTQIVRAFGISMADLHLPAGIVLS